MSSQESQQLTYSEAMKQLEAIVAKLQDPNCDIDLLRDYTKQALSLLKYCKKSLTCTDEEVKKLLNELENEQIKPLPQGQ